MGALAASVLAFVGAAVILGVSIVVFNAVARAAGWRTRLTFPGWEDIFLRRERKGRN
jgi:hypothetical protein